MRAVLSVLIIILLMLLVGLVCLAILLGWSIGWGGLLMRWLPFTLFEASLLILAGTTVVGYVLWRIFSAPVSNPNWADEDEEEEDEEEYPIPQSRFLEDQIGRTGETWFRYELSNDLFLSIQNNPKLRGMMGQKQLEELAIRLVDVMVAFWKMKRIQGGRVSITLESMRKQMEKMGQRPYDDDILQTAVFCANRRLSADDELREVVADKRWDEVWDW